MTRTLRNFRAYIVVNIRNFSSALEKCATRTAEQVEASVLTTTTQKPSLSTRRFCIQELKKQRVEEGRNADARGRGVGAGDEHGSGSGGRKSKPIFLDKMRGEQVDAMGLEERMKRNRHYQQRGADVHNFMERG